jgi:hypothetical protein
MNLLNHSSCSNLASRSLLASQRPIVLGSNPTPTPVYFYAMSLRLAEIDADQLRAEISKNGQPPTCHSAIAGNCSYEIYQVQSAAIIICNRNLLLQSGSGMESRYLQEFIGL